MTRQQVSDEAEDALFRVFENLQGGQRRVLRIIARGFFNAYGLNELRSQLGGALAEVDALLAGAAEDDPQG